MLLWLILFAFFMMVFMYAFRKEEEVERKTNKKLEESLEILKLRYAKGEVNTDEYLEIKRNLEGEKNE